MRMTYTDQGAGRPIVLIHAFPLSKDMWRRQADFLLDHGFRVILPDLPGFGENKDAASVVSIEEMAIEVGGVLKTLGIDKAIIGGLSMGGYVSINLYGLMPELFAALIMCDTTHAADTAEKRNSRFELISKIEKSGSLALVEEMLPNLVAEDTKRSQPELISALEKEVANVDSQAAVNALKSLAERKDHTNTLEKIDVPTLLIFGEFDKVTNLEQARTMEQLISDSELVLIKNAGHYSSLEQPADFNEALINFTEKIEF